MNQLIKCVVVVLLLAGGSATSLPAASLKNGLPAVEEFRYSWRLRGGLAWVAGLAFPTSGTGALRTIQPTPERNFIDSELIITSPQGREGFYLYQSHIDESGDKTLMTYHGYEWRNKSRHERTFFDYVKRLARIREETPQKVETRVRPIPPKSMRDVLTGIYFLRNNTSKIQKPIISEIYSDGKIYPVIFRPLGQKTLTFEGQKIPSRGYQISAAPGSTRRWPGGVKVWISDDERHIPLRIEIHRNLASLQLELSSIETGAIAAKTDGK